MIFDENALKENKTHFLQELMIFNQSLFTNTHAGHNGHGNNPRNNLKYLIH